LGQWGKKESRQRGGENAEKNLSPERGSFVLLGMIAQCLKCGKDYEPKRRGGKFCSTSCRVVQHQLVKKGKAWTNPKSGDEQYLANKLEAVGRSSVEALAQVKGMPIEEGFAQLKALVEGWTRVADNSIIQNILWHERKSIAALADRTLHKMEATSVKNKRKEAPQA
jgi:predicted amidophosphoribosyltransferase